MMITMVEDEEDTDGEIERRLVQKSVQVRVGQAVDVVAQVNYNYYDISTCNLLIFEFLGRTTSNNNRFA
jgi:uncharacterized protein YprB with RNaseH-like and TPR domain